MSDFSRFPPQEQGRELFKLLDAQRKSNKLLGELIKGNNTTIVLIGAAVLLEVVILLVEIFK